MAIGDQYSPVTLGNQWLLDANERIIGVRNLGSGKADFRPVTVIADTETPTSTQITLSQMASIKTGAGAESWSILTSARAANEVFAIDVAPSGTITPVNVLHTLPAVGSFSFSIRGNSTTTLASVLAIGKSTTIIFASPNTSPAYFANSIALDGAASAILWTGGFAPTAGNSNAVDIYGFTILRTGPASYFVFGNQTKHA